jgi:acetate kinase
MKILLVNAGSSSLKSSLYDFEELPEFPVAPLWQGQIDWHLSSGKSEFQVNVITGPSYHAIQATIDRTQDSQQLLQLLWSGATAVLDSPHNIDLVGHRVVHGGDIYQTAVWIDQEVQTNIDRLSQFAPLHNPANLAGIQLVQKLFGDVRQVAVFDTAFHSQLPAAANVYPLPYHYWQQGIKRYGFHGISHQYCGHRAAQLLGKNLADLRLIVCHLGNGCSLSAIHGGHSIDTTMGFTPLDGLMMGTRSGSIDPGILLHLMRTEHLNHQDLELLLNQHSGFLGLSGVSADLPDVQAAMAAGNAQAQLAFDVFIHCLRRQLGSMLASLGWVDAIIFTAGIGEHSPAVRAATCHGWDFLQLELNQELNALLCSPSALAANGDTDISSPHSAVRLFVIHSQENWAILHECWRLHHNASIGQ